MKYPRFKISFCILLTTGWIAAFLGSCGQSEKKAEAQLLVNCSFGEPIGDDTVKVLFAMEAAMVDQNGDSLPITQNVDSLIIFSKCVLKDGKRLQLGHIQEDSSSVGECEGNAIDMKLPNISEDGSAFDINLKIEPPHDADCNGNVLRGGGIIVIIVESLTEPPLVITKEFAQGWHDGHKIPTQLN